MAKKVNTLGDLTTFLKSDSIGAIKDFTSEVETDFFQKKPLTLVNVDKDLVVKTDDLNKTEKVNSNQPLSWEELEKQINRFASDNNTTVEAIVTKLKTSNEHVHPFISMLTWTVNFQWNYFKFWSDWQRSFWNK